jgi:hypothetical protein
MSDDPLFARDGRLTDLTLERYHYGELDADEAGRLEAHLAAHPAEAARLERLVALEGEVGALPFPAELSQPEPVPAPANSWRYVGVVVMAAAVLLFARSALLQPTAPTGPDNGIRYRGGTVELQVFRQGGGQLAWKDVVAPGDRLGFRVGSSEPGHLVIAGLDATGSAYGILPTSGTAGPVEAGDAHEVDAAIELDDAGDWERLVAVVCPEPMPTTAVTDALRTAWRSAEGETLPALLPDCGQAELLLRKRAP